MYGKGSNNHQEESCRSSWEKWQLDRNRFSSSLKAQIQLKVDSSWGTSDHADSDAYSAACGRIQQDSHMLHALGTNPWRSVSAKRSYDHRTSCGHGPKPLKQALLWGSKLSEVFAKGNHRRHFEPHFHYATSTQKAASAEFLWAFCQGSCCSTTPRRTKNVSMLGICSPRVGVDLCPLSIGERTRFEIHSSQSLWFNFCFFSKSPKGHGSRGATVSGHYSQLTHPRGFVREGLLLTRITTLCHASCVEKSILKKKHRVCQVP